MAGNLKQETLSRSLWMQTDTKLNDTTARTAFILSKLLCIILDALDLCKISCDSNCNIN